ncbi:MAG: helix-turn-helix domain-containing protein [Treponema sp.]|jgi:transcriptional regulator with XRE-family HTH domain|nr:helix-turn-helix domain-containing protein [Treponema sp.]
MGFRENLKAELADSDMLVKELAKLSGVKKQTIDSYLREKNNVPSVEAGLKIAQALGVSVEYLVTGKESKKTKEAHEMKNDVQIIARLAEKLDDEKRKFIIDFIKWIKIRENKR